MDRIKIKKGKIKNNLFLQYEYLQTIDNVTNSHNTSSDAPIHDDLRAAFKGLIPHYAFISKEITEKKMQQYINDKLSNEDEMFLMYNVNSFSIGGSGDSEGVTLTGTKQVQLGVINFSTPFLKWEDEYKFIDELIEAVELVKSEVHEYLNGKQAPKAQQEMSFEDFDTDEVFMDNDQSFEEPSIPQSIAALKRTFKGAKVTVSTSIN